MLKEHLCNQERVGPEIMSLVFFFVDIFPKSIILHRAWWYKFNGVYEISISRLVFEILSVKVYEFFFVRSDFFYEKYYFV